MHANGVAGLQAVEPDGDRIENIDLTEIVSGNYLNNNKILLIFKSLIEFKILILNKVVTYSNLLI